MSVETTTLDDRPRTAAGRALLAWLDLEGIDPAVAYTIHTAIMAIEGEANPWLWPRPVAASACNHKRGNLTVEEFRAFAARRPFINGYHRWRGGLNAEIAAAQAARTRERFSPA